MPISRDRSITVVNPTEQPELDFRHRNGRKLAKLPPPKEYKLQIDIMEHFRWRRAPGWKGFHTANGEKRDPRIGAKLKAMGVEPGIPDLVFIAPDARSHFLEVKRRGERITTDSPQDLFRQHAELWGWPWAWADELDEALRILEGWGALLPSLYKRGPK